MNRSLAPVLFLFTLLAPAGARAETPSPAPRLGAPGQVVFSSESSLAFTSTHLSDDYASFSSFTLDLAADVFVVPHLSVGAELTYENLSGSPSEPIAKRYGGGLRVGYALPLSARLDVWPRVGLQYAKVTEEAGLSASFGDVIGGAGFPYGAEGTQWIVTASAPLVYTPVPHFFVGFGPSLAVPVASSDSYPRLWSLGAALTIGGTLGGEPDAAREPEDDAPPPADDAAPVRRFGDRGTVALTSALGLGLTYTNAGDGASDVRFQVSPAFDYFAWKGISLGLNPSFTKAPAADLLPTTLDDDVYTLGLGARVGVNIPLGDLFSIWPHLGVGASMWSQGSSFHPRTTLWATLDAPVLVHPAPHLFAGFGPTLYHELGSFGGDDLEGSNDYPTATTLGCSLVVGGWL